ncbi:unnamed protein product [Parnassius mnemosyne]|uniref:GAG-pre-integrase domain-containing protein n=1 Tax=Parnassius mnemosyne TaxID=213953 RepID=A0AAV1L1N4_9NEOP
MFQNFNNKKSHVSIANNTYLDSEGSGKFIIPCFNIEIGDMLVLKLATKLLSVSRLIKSGYVLVFDKKGCHFYKVRDCKVTGKVHGHAADISGVYKLDSITPGGNTSQPIGCSLGLLKNRVQEKQSAMLVSSELWHKRPGHMNYGGMCTLRQKKALIFQNEEHELSGCVAYLKGKQVSKAYPSGEGKWATSRLELIHSEICGPMPVKSWGGAKYMLTLTDDYSRKSWMYLLQEKNQNLTQPNNSMGDTVISSEGSDINIKNDETGQEYRTNTVHLKKVEGQWKIYDHDKEVQIDNCLKDKRNADLDKLVAKYREVEENANRQTKKNKSLKTNYKKEKKKVENSKRSGAGADVVFEPKLWYFKELIFFDDQIEPRASCSNINDEEEDLRDEGNEEQDSINCNYRQAS